MNGVDEKINNYILPNIFINKTILIAEDDDTNFFLLKEYLDFSGAEVLWARDGKEAVEIVSNKDDIDVIIMDIQMPILDGLQAMKLIKETKPTIPIIALTAFAVMGDREKGLKAGFDEYATKPISRRFLIELLLKHI